MEQVIHENFITPNLSAGPDNADLCFLRKLVEQIPESQTSIHNSSWKIRGITKPGRCYCSSVGRGHWQRLAQLSVGSSGIDCTQNLIREKIRK